MAQEFWLLRYVILKSSSEFLSKWCFKWKLAPYYAVGGERTGCRPDQNSWETFRGQLGSLRVLARRSERLWRNRQPAIFRQPLHG